MDQIRYGEQLELEHVFFPFSSVWSVVLRVFVHVRSLTRYKRHVVLNLKLKLHPYATCYTDLVLLSGYKPGEGDTQS